MVLGEAGSAPATPAAQISLHQAVDDGHQTEQHEHPHGEGQHRQAQGEDLGDGHGGYYMAGLR